MALITVPPVYRLLAVALIYRAAGIPASGVQRVNMLGLIVKYCMTKSSQHCISIQGFVAMKFELFFPTEDHVVATESGGAVATESGEAVATESGGAATTGDATAGDDTAANCGVMYAAEGPYTIDVHHVEAMMGTTTEAADGD